MGYVLAYNGRGAEGEIAESKQTCSTMIFALAL